VPYETSQWCDKEALLKISKDLLQLARSATKEAIHGSYGHGREVVKPHFTV